MGFWPAGFVLIRWILALQGLISAKSWAFLGASKELVLIRKGFRKKWAEKPTLYSAHVWKAHVSSGHGNRLFVGTSTQIY